MFMSTISQAEASKPLQQKEIRECNRCKAAGFPNQLIGFEMIGQDFTTRKSSWRLIDDKHKFVQDLPVDKSEAARLHLDAEKLWI